MSELNPARIMVILLFAITFTLVGWTSPVIYASNVPSDDIIEVHNFKAQDTTVTSGSHYICFDRTVERGSSAYVFTELYLLDSDGQRIEIDSMSMRGYFHEGRANVITPLKLPDNLQSGEYRYVVAVKMDMANGRVTRDIAFESQKFDVTLGSPVELSRPNC